ncbi:MAG: GNAT family N-acetyltransferase [Micropruina sp.]|uniref:GNAT family N-acetyltransferase n=1 Tax=Micropruina sp. TaxID=2737536 RepID=UPI0039E62ECB
MSGYRPPRPLNPGDDLESFTSGDPSLDDYLRHRALSNHLGGGSRTYVTVREGRVVGYYALASAAAYHRDVAGRYRRNMPDPIPVILLSRLAVDITDQGGGLGKHLLRDAISRSVDAADIIGVRAILVHALHEHARDFCLRHDFEPSPTDPLHLLLLVKDARAILGK